MFTQFEWLFQIFNAVNSYENAFIAYVIYLGIALVVVLLRVGLFFGYQAQRTIVSMNARPVKSLSELKDARHNNILARVARDYIGLCESGVTTVDVKSISELHVSKLNFLGLSLPALNNITEGFERNFALVGLLLALIFEPARIAFGLSAVALWLLIRLLNSVFNAPLIRDHLTNEVFMYVSREVAKFFTPDLTASLTALRNTLSNAIEVQSDTLASASRGTSESLSAAVSKSMSDMTRSIDHTLVKLADADTFLKEPLSHWNNQINRAAQLQDNENQSNERLLHAIAQFSDVANALVDMQRELEKHSPAKTVKSYETALEDLTARLSGGFGTMLDQHVNRALADLTQGLEYNAETLVRSNQELTQILRQIADRLDEHGRSETRAIAAIKEQIDMRLDELK